MVPRIVHVSGPRHSGKSAVARRIAWYFPHYRPGYVRLSAVPAGEKPPATATATTDFPPMPEMADVRAVAYSPERVFEQVPEAIRQAADFGQGGFLVVESDADACLRMALRHDLRIFVMGCPALLAEVFRSPGETSEAVQRVMQDTGSFASEVFGVQRNPALDDSGTFRTSPARAAAVSDVQPQPIHISPLRAEIEARMALQPGYHTLVDSDIVLLNAGVGARGEMADLCARRLERLLANLPVGRHRCPRFLCCDVLDPRDPLATRLLQIVAEVVTR